MIKFADNSTEAAVREMWRECFGDGEEFMDMYFSRKYRNGDTLVYLVGGTPVASLQMHPYRMTFYGKEIDMYYLSGICTLPQHRGNGYASELIAEAHRELRRRGVLLAVLIPASPELYGYYADFDYEKVFESDPRPIPLGEILDSSADIKEAYALFDAIYRNRDFCVQKSFDDFTVIVDDYTIDGRPPKTYLDGVAYLIDPLPLLQIYAANSPTLSFTLRLEGAAACQQETLYIIDGGKVTTRSDSNNDNATAYNMADILKGTVITADRRLLTRLLFGHKTHSLPEPYRSLFPERSPIMNLMLE